MEIFEGATEDSCGQAVQRRGGRGASPFSMMLSEGEETEMWRCCPVVRASLVCSDARHAKTSSPFFLSSSLLLFFFFFVVSALFFLGLGSLVEWEGGLRFGFMEGYGSKGRVWMGKGAYSSEVVGRWFMVLRVLVVEWWWGWEFFDKSLDGVGTVMGSIGVWVWVGCGVGFWVAALLLPGSAPQIEIML